MKSLPPDDVDKFDESCKYVSVCMRVCGFCFGSGHNKNKDKDNMFFDKHGAIEPMQKSSKKMRIIVAIINDMRHYLGFGYILLDLC